MIKNCPKCGSEDTEEVEYLDTKLILCYKCHFDERDEYDIVSEGRSSQKAKREYNVYKTGGSKRSKK